MPPKKKAEVKDDGVWRFGRVKNNLKMGIVGLPNVGKSSLFNLLTKSSMAKAENFPFCTIDPNESRCIVPDARYEHLCSLWKPPSQQSPFLNVIDIAGLVKGAAEGEGMGNEFLSHIGAADGIFHVVRAFADSTIEHVESSVDPVRDLEIIQRELCQNDLKVLEAALKKENKEVRAAAGTKLSQLFVDTMAKVRAMLEEGKPVKDAEWTSPEIELICAKLGTLCTTKPVIYLVNIKSKHYRGKKDADSGEMKKWVGDIKTWVKGHGGGAIVPFSITYEEDLAKAEDEAAFLASSGGQSALPKMIHKGYEALNLIHYFTAGEKEVRAWTLLSGSTAPQAAGVIHSDFQKFFHKAEVCSYADFFAHQKTKGLSEVKAAGKYRQEGKGYIVQDGDIMHFIHTTAKK